MQRYCDHAKRDSATLRYSVQRHSNYTIPRRRNTQTSQLQRYCGTAIERCSETSMSRAVPRVPYAWPRNVLILAHACTNRGLRVPYALAPHALLCLDFSVLDHTHVRWEKRGVGTRRRRAHGHSEPQRPHPPRGVHSPLSRLGSGARGNTMFCGQATWGQRLCLCAWARLLVHSAVCRLA